MSERFVIERVAISNFRNILNSQVDVSEGPTYIVGPNGSGKTNFLNALYFIRRGLSDSLETAVKAAGGIPNIVPAHTDFPSTTSLHLQWKSSDQSHGFYTVELRFESNRAYAVAREECETTDTAGHTSRFVVEFGVPSGTPEILPAGAPDRLYLVQASGLPEFRSVYEALSGMQNSEPFPPALHTLSFGKRSDYEGFANRVIVLKESSPERLEIIEQYMRAALPSFLKFGIGVLKSELPFLQFIENTHLDQSLRFSVDHMSSGSVYLADLLIGLFSPPNSANTYLPSTIEEPETGLHPGAIRIIRDAIFEASSFRQIILTTHSPEFLDDERLSDRNILAAYRDGRGAHISNLNAGTRRILRESLYTPGELLQQGLLAFSDLHPAADRQ